MFTVLSVQYDLMTVQCIHVLVNSGIGIDYLKKMDLELINFELEFPTKKKLNPQINLPFNFLIQKHFFHDNPTRNINYSEYLLIVKVVGIWDWN